MNGRTNTEAHFTEQRRTGRKGHFMELLSQQALCRTQFAFLAIAGYLQAQTLKQTPTIDLPGPKGERFDYLTMDSEDGRVNTSQSCRGVASLFCSVRSFR